MKRHESGGPVAILLRLIDDANEYMLNSGHQHGCPESDDVEAKGCPCGFVEAKKRLTETLAEAKDLVETYT